MTHSEQFHTGIDIPIPIGTPVLAAWNGHVARVDVPGVGRGEINGYAVHLAAGEWVFSYLHLSGVSVRKGQAVQRGQVLGLSGATGRVSGPHLHFQATLSGLVVDPRVIYPGLFYEV